MSTEPTEPEKNSRSTEFGFDPETPLYRQLGLDPDERVLVTLLPEYPESVEGFVTDHSLGDKRYPVTLYVADLGPLGERVVDASVPSGKPVRWWQVTAICRLEKADWLPIRYDGPVSDIPINLLTRSDYPMLRLSVGGPWIQLRNPQTKEDSNAVHSGTDSPGI